MDVHVTVRSLKAVRAAKKGVHTAWNLLARFVGVCRIGNPHNVNGLCIRQMPSPTDSTILI